MFSHVVSRRHEGQREGDNKPNSTGLNFLIIMPFFEKILNLSKTQLMQEGTADPGLHSPTRPGGTPARRSARSSSPSAHSPVSRPSPSSLTCLASHLAFRNTVFWCSQTAPNEGKMTRYEAMPLTQCGLLDCMAFSRAGKERLGLLARKNGCGGSLSEGGMSPADSFHDS